MCGLVFVLPEGICVAESLWTGRARQLHAQVGPTHMVRMNRIRHLKEDHTGLQHQIQPWPILPLGGPQPPAVGFLVEEGSLLQQMQTLKKGEIVHKDYAILNIAMKQLRIEREVNTR